MLSVWDKGILCLPIPLQTLSPGHRNAKTPFSPSHSNEKFSPPNKSHQAAPFAQGCAPLLLSVPLTSAPWGISRGAPKLSSFSPEPAKLGLADAGLGDFPLGNSSAPLPARLSSSPLTFLPLNTQCAARQLSLASSQKGLQHEGGENGCLNRGISVMF